MKYVLLVLFVHGVLADVEFAKSYLRDSRLCHQWTCINQKLGLEDSLPDKGRYTDILKGLLPPGAWQSVVDDVLNICYGDNKPRRYTNTCPGQALLHCVVDNLIQNCPENNLRKDDSCAPLSSLAGFKYMFAQSRYKDMEKNLPTERRPIWFLKNYFSSKCCDLPPLFNTTVLEECGFQTIVHYYDRPGMPKSTPKTVTEFKPVELKTIRDAVQVAKSSNIDSQDVLDCCDMSELFPAMSRQECKFQLTWDEKKRLDFAASDLPEAVTTPKPDLKPKYHDVKVVPLSCAQENCVFQKLGIVSETGDVDVQGFSKLLDKLIKRHPKWSKAKARVVTSCLSKPIKDYAADCEINKILACTFDVLSENCPHMKKPHQDPCKHTHVIKNDTVCQINSSKYRAKNRRQFCDFPSFISHEVLEQCNVSSISKVESVPFVQFALKPYKWRSLVPACKTSSSSTKCLMSKLDVLNKYEFLDYFKMVGRIRNFVNDHPEWSNLADVYIGAFNSIPMYQEHCASPRKLLNVIDIMAMTCPVSRRKNSDKCNKIFLSMAKGRKAVSPSTIRPYTHKTPVSSNINILIPSKLTLTTPAKLYLKPKDENSILVRLPVYMNTPKSNIQTYTPINNHFVPQGTLYSNPFHQGSLFRSNLGPISMPPILPAIGKR